MTAFPPSGVFTSPETLAEPDSERLLLDLRQQIDLDQLNDQDTHLFPQIISALNDPRQDLRIGLIELLGEIGESATPWICAALCEHPSPRVRQACAKALTTIGDPDGVPALMQAFTQDLETEVRGAAIGALAHLGASAVAPLLALLADPNHSEITQGQAQWAISTAGLDAPELIYDHIDTPSPVVRAGVIGAIARILQANPEKIDQPPGISPVLIALQAPEPLVCCAAITALGLLRYTPANQRLEHLLTTHPHPDVRQAAALGLLRLGNPDTQGILSQQLTEEVNPEVRQSLELALKQLVHGVS